MKTTDTSWVDWAISAGFGLLVWMFFAFCYPYHLHYQEQMQLFLLTPDYLHEQLEQPGGLAIYVGGFITQCCYYALLGAFLLALLLTLLQRLTAVLVSMVTDKPAYRLLTSLPAILYALLFLNEDVMVSGLVALVVSLLAACFYPRIRTVAVRVAYLLLLTPLLGWLIGASFIVFVACCLLLEWVAKEGIKSRFTLGVITLFALLVMVLTPLVEKAIVVQLPLQRLVLAGNYYRYVSQFPLSILFIQLSVVGVMMAIKWLPVARPAKEWLLQGIQLILLAGLVVPGIMFVANWEKEEVMAYDYHVRMKQWYVIRAMAEKQAPTGPLTVTTLNLALSQTGYLPDEMFSYFQNGPEGLLPAFAKDFISSVMVGEVYYYLGMVNTAQRFAFEAMESMPDYQKSVRCVKRLAETNLITGRYDLAEKYLNMLQRTLFYKQWATDTRACLRDEARINAHPEWGLRRKCLLKEDFLFSENEKDQMLGLLYQSNPYNRMAFEYLMAYIMLSKDLKHFRAYYEMGDKHLAYHVVPKSYQEAMAYIWSMTNPNEPPPVQISKSVMQRLIAYRQVYTSVANAEPLLRKDFSDTYWYYVQFRRQ